MGLALLEIKQDRDGSDFFFELLYLVNN